METIQELENIVIVSNETDFIANCSEKISANFIVLCEDNFESALEKNIYEYEILGMSLLNWVSRACNSQPMRLRAATNDVLSLVKPYATNADYTVVLYANTPLINKQHLNDLLAFVDRRHIHACKLKKGYIFKNEYIRRVDEIYSIDTYDFAGEDFFEVNNLQDLAFAEKVVKERMIAYHNLNGVVFENTASVNLDATAEIGYGSQIAGGVSIINHSVIGSNCSVQAGAFVNGSKIADYAEIGANAIIVNSVVKTGAKIDAGVCIKDSVVGQNVIVEMGAMLSQSAIKDNCVVSEKSYVKSSSIKENTFVGDMATLVNARVAENVKIENCVLVVGENQPVIVESGALLQTRTEIVETQNKAGE